jgi:carbamoyl-phosphate synthase/aspartate carbamoyltransferase
MPRWDLKKFSQVSNKLGSSMLSVGEVMAIGRTFEETIQKACRMVNPGLDGLDGTDSNLVKNDIPLETQLKSATDTRIFAVQMALELGWTVEKVHQLTKIDRWFLSKLKNISNMREACIKGGSLDALVRTNGRDRFRALKMAGFSDRQIARYVGLPQGVDGESRIRDK